jgi:hypothetical protein
MRNLKLLMGAALLLISTSSLAVDIGQIEKELTTTGVQGWIHGSVPERHLYVFTYRNPNDFFDYIQMSLVADTPAIDAQIAVLGRHDRVLVKGSFMDNPSPQKHINVTSIQLLEKYNGKYPSEPYQYEAKIPDELTNINKASFLVHAIAGDGHILVVEYKDQILPIFVKNAALTQGLFRGDVVLLSFAIQRYPDHPSHLKLNETAPDALKVTDSIHSIHGKQGSIEGALILFPKSPEILFNVFAVQQIIGNGQGGQLKRQFTLVNFDDPAEFAKIRKALQAAWDRHPGEYVNGRNKLVSKVIRVRATGTFNEVDPSQANPQILLKNVNSVQILEQN